MSSATYARSDSPTGTDYRNYRDSRVISPPLDSGARMGSGYFNNMPTSASLAPSRTPKTPHSQASSAGRHNPSPSLDGIMSLEDVRQVEISHCSSE